MLREPQNSGAFEFSEEKRRPPRQFFARLSSSGEDFSSQPHPHNDVVVGLGSGGQGMRRRPRKVVKDEGLK